MATGNPARRELGFSLVELMIAMVATLVITGAVMQLVGAGKGAFRREPEVSDRQQNIRMAMSMIQKDIHAAGLGMPPFVQAFTTGLNAVGPTVPSGGRADELEIMATTDCPSVELCRNNGTGVDAWEMLPACYNLPNMIALWNDQEAGIFWGENPGGTGGGGSNSACPNPGTGGGGGSTGGGGNGGGGNGGGGQPGDDLPGRSADHNPHGGPPGQMGTTPAHGPGLGVGSSGDHGRGH